MTATNSQSKTESNVKIIKNSEIIWSTNSLKKAKYKYIQT